MQLRDVWRGFAGQSVTVTALSVFGGFAVAPVLAVAAKAFLGVYASWTGVSAAPVIILAFPLLLGVVSAECGGGLLSSWLVGLPYFVMAVKALECYSPGVGSEVASCAPKSLVDVLLIAVPGSVITGTVGFAIAAIGARSSDGRSGRLRPTLMAAGTVLVALLAFSLAGIFL